MPVVPIDIIYADGPSSSPSNPPKLDLRDTFNYHIGRLNAVADTGITSSNIELTNVSGLTALGFGTAPSHIYNPGAALLTGLGTTVIGRDAMSASNTNNTYSIYAGFWSGLGANNNYCVEAVGLRTGHVLVDGQYVSMIGTDTGYSLTYARNSVLLGAKSALYKTSMEDSISIVGGYCGGIMNDAIAIGHGCADGGQTNAVYSLNNVLLIGRYCGRYVSGATNTFVGNNSASINPVTGTFNASFGRASLASLSSGIGNTAIGDGSGAVVQTGNYNVAIGYNVTLGTAARTNCVALGYQSGGSLTGDNQVQLGSTSHSVYVQAAVNVRSDERDKADIEELDLGLDFIMALKTKKYRMDQRERYAEHSVDEVLVEEEYEDLETDPKTDEATSVKKKRFVTQSIPKVVELPRDGSRKSKRVSTGLIAQDVGALVQKLDWDFAGWQDHSVNGGSDVQSLAYEQFIAPIIKAVQEQQVMITSLQAEVAALKAAQENHHD